MQSIKNMDSTCAGIILAAGKGTRMKGDLPKCMQPVCELPMVEHLVRSFRTAGISRPTVVVGYHGEVIVHALDSEVDVVWQHEQLGTGHAVLMAKELLQDFDGPVVVVSGDCPLISPNSLIQIINRFKSEGAAAVVGSVKVNSPAGYGRIERTEAGEFEQIIEQKDANEAQQKIGEINVSVYCFDSKLLFSLLPKLTSNNAQREYYLTEVLTLIRQQGKKILIHQFADEQEFQGVNDRWQLALAEDSLRLRILKKHAINGVTIRNLYNIFIGPDVEIEPNVVIESGSHLGNHTKIDAGATIGPYSVLNDCHIEENCKIIFSHLLRCEVGSNSTIGPFANIRPHAKIGKNCKIGNFVEVKNSVLDESVSASHLSYIGDAHVGRHTNIGAGTIFCNYDGFEKHRTEIGEEVFIGSNSTIVAPCTIGKSAMVSAGSVVTIDVPEGAVAFGRARTEIKIGWATQWRQRKRQHLELQRKSAEIDQQIEANQ